MLRRYQMRLNCLHIHKKIVPALVAAVLFISISISPFVNSQAQAATAKEIDVSVEVALDRFKNDVAGAEEFLNNAKGVLVIPNIIRIGFMLGGEYGEGALLIDGQTVDYYNTAVCSFGFQIGAQSKNLIIIFMDENALTKFRDSLGWEAGVDGSIAVIDMGAGGSVDSTNVKHPIVGFVYGLKGLMVNISLEGSKFTKLIK